MNTPSSGSSPPPTYAFTPATVSSLPIGGSTTRFPVNRIYCVGRNYADHAREMGHDPDRELPFFFMKPASALVSDGGNFPYPTLSQDVQHEVELVVALGRGGSHIAASNALQHVFGYAVGLDMTRRDLQGEAKKMGRPWDTGKAFDHSAPCGTLVAGKDFAHLTDASVTLTINDQERQTGNLRELIWNVPDTIAYLSTLFTLQAGDLIFTGTPAGVGPVQRGERLLAQVQGLPELDIQVV